MTLSELQKHIPLKPIHLADDREIHGVYAGDLLSRAMSHVASDNLWITIMNNKNVIAVATLCDPAAVILAEDVVPMEDAVIAAKEADISMFVTPLSVYELCRMLADVLPDDRE